MNTPDPNSATFVLITYVHGVLELGETKLSQTFFRSILITPLLLFQPAYLGLCSQSMFPNILILQSMKRRAWDTYMLMNAMLLYFWWFPSQFFLLCCMFVLSDDDSEPTNNQLPYLQLCFQSSCYGIWRGLTRSSVGRCLLRWCWPGQRKTPWSDFVCPVSWKQLSQQL